MLGIEGLKNWRKMGDVVGLIGFELGREVC